MRIRTIKPEFWAHPVLSRLDDSARVLAIGVLNIADDEGYFLADPALIRSSIWPLDEDSSKARRTLADLSRAGYIEVRKHATHGLVGLVLNFTKHQRVDRPSTSKIRTYFDSTNDRRMIDERSLLEQGTGNREQGTSIPPAVAAGAGEVLKLEGEEQKPQATTPPHALPPEPPKAKKPRERDPLFDALAVACGNSPHELTKTAARECAVALAEIRSVSPGLTSAEIHLRSANYRSHFPDAACTAFALAKHWARCGEQFRQTPQQLRPAVC